MPLRLYYGLGNNPESGWIGVGEPLISSNGDSKFYRKYGTLPRISAGGLMNDGYINYEIEQNRDFSIEFNYYEN